MVQHILQFRVDLIGFTVMVLLGAMVVHLLLRGMTPGQGLSRVSWALLLPLILTVAWASEIAGHHEKERLRNSLSGLAPTYAAEMQKLGHWKLPLDAPPDDPLYLKLIEAQRRWLSLNPAIDDIYTMRIRDDGKLVLVVDSETDYNRNGLIDEPREHRTPLGEVYANFDEQIARAFTGQASFDGKVVCDRWGSWVSAYEPLYDPEGNVEAILGVDYDAGRWAWSILRWRLITLGYGLTLVVVHLVTASVLSVRRQELARRINASLHDPLTLLPNRDLLNERLGQWVNQARREPARCFAVFFMDLDRFKLINDSLGHEVGDCLLVGVSDRIREALRSAPTHHGAPLEHMAARLGGDEFVILAGGIGTNAQASLLAKHLHRTLSAPFHIRGYEIHCTSCIGITLSTLCYERGQDMLRDADNAMYRAKAAGKGSFVIFDQSMHDEVVARLQLEQDLHRAIERRELSLAFQPIVCLETARIKGFEALLRWEHPLLGSVPPSTFVPMAEESDQVGPLGTWVLEEACRTAASWPLVEGRAPYVSVNLSRRQLCIPGLCDLVAMILARTGLDAHRLKLEITESALMRDPESAIRVMRKLKKMGVQLQLDDFGTGYSSLSCLHGFPIHAVKLDQAFIAHANKRRDYAAVIQSIVMLTHNLNVELIAEGVETPEQVALLQAMGCNAAQGFYFARPLKSSDVPGYIRHHHTQAA